MFLTKNPKGKKYCSLKNASGKKWLFDYEALNVGLCLYQPSSTKGRLIKTVLRICSRKRFLRQFLKKQNYLLDKNFDDAAKRAFACNDIQYSIFYGTPGPHCKIVGQASSKCDILGYFKVTNSPVIYNLFKDEFDLITYLRKSGVNKVPIPIDIKIINGEYVYFQTTKKTANSNIPTKYDHYINQFLHELYEQTCEKIQYEYSALYKNIHDVKFSKENLFEEKYLSYISLFDRQFSNEIIDTCVVHRDFVPWNMFLEKEELFVFDWEYASKGYFPMIDMFHFEIQRKIMDEGLGIHGVIRYLEDNWDSYKSYISKITQLDVHWILMAYLLDFIALYVNRGEDLSIDEMEFVKLRFDLLQYVEKTYL